VTLKIFRTSSILVSICLIMGAVNFCSIHHGETRTAKKASMLTAVPLEPRVAEVKMG
jgi:hypothetical protein